VPLELVTPAQKRIPRCAQNDKTLVPFTKRRSMLRHYKNWN